MKKHGIIWFDCDGVLTDHHSSWAFLHEYFGSGDNKFFAELYRRGVISYLDWMKIDIALMIHAHGKPITRKEVVKALENIGVKREAIDVVKELKEKGFVVGVISSGIDILVKRICNMINCDICLYNELYFIDDILVPGGRDHVPLLEKDRIIEDESRRLGFNLGSVVYVGDSEWDMKVFEKVGLSIAVEPCGNACKHADYTVKDLREIIGIVEKYYGIS